MLWVTSQPSLSPATIPPNIPNSGVYKHTLFIEADPNPHHTLKVRGTIKHIQTWQTPPVPIPAQPHIPLPNIRPRVNCCSGMSTSSSLSFSSSLMPKLSTVGTGVLRKVPDRSTWKTKELESRGHWETEKKLWIFTGYHICLIYVKLKLKMSRLTAWLYCQTFQKFMFFGPVILFLKNYS